MCRILQLCPFPITDKPSSGGQIRIDEISKVYRYLGAEVTRSCIVTRSRDLAKSTDVLMPWWHRVRRKHIGRPSNIGPLRQYWSTSGSDFLLNKVLSGIVSKVDVIHIEHPWLIPMAKKLRSHPLLEQAVLVYSSHNIESALYESMWREAGMWNRNAEALQHDILEAEMEAAREADIVWAVSETDANILSGWGAREVFVAPNGCRMLPKRRGIKGLPVKSYALFAGTAYGPNVNGFQEWLGEKLDYIPPGTAIATVGSCGQIFSTMPSYKKSIDEGRFINYGWVEQPFLDQLLLHASAIVLPVSAGGGTNLKTAEAIMSLRPVISTSYAMRGYESWGCAEFIYTEDSPKGFQERVVQMLSLDALPDRDSMGVASLSWRSCLLEAAKSVLVKVSTFKGYSNCV